MSDQVAGWLISGASVTTCLTVIISAILAGVTDLPADWIAAHKAIRLSEEETKREAMKLGVPVPRERFTLNPYSWRSLITPVLASGITAGVIQLALWWLKGRAQ